MRPLARGLLDRRTFLKSAADGVYATALASLLQHEASRGTRLHAAEVEGPEPRRIHDLKARPPHFPARARAVIHIVTEGGPSQVDLFDPKEALSKNHGKSVFHQIADAVSAPRSAGALMRSPY